MAAVPKRLPNRGAPTSDPPPPVLPPRPSAGGRTARPPPATPPAQNDHSGSVADDCAITEEIYDDCDENGPAGPEVYDDCEETRPVPAPPEELYDDCAEQPPLPQRPAAKLPPDPPALPPQETYDDLDNVGPIVQQLPKKPTRQLPPTPPSTPPSSAQQLEVVEQVYEDPDASQVPPPPADNSRSVYELGNDGVSRPSQPPLLPLKDQKGSEQRLPPQPAKPATSSGGKAAPMGIAIDSNQLQGLRAGLRKVSVGTPPETNSHEPKEYGEIEQSVSAVKRKFQDKAEGKPALLPKFGKAASNSGATTTNNSINAVKPNSLSTGLKPAPTVQQASSPGAPDVTFLPKASRDKDKHTNVPLPAVPTPQQTVKPVTKFQPNEEDLQPPDDIYDDACSGDVLDKFDWYHGCINRQNGERRVKAIGKDGTYLVRISEKDPKFPYTLVVLHNGHVNNLRIRKRADNKFALGDEKSDELAFEDVTGMINHHKNHNVVLLGNNQSQVKLQTTPPKG